MIVLFVGFCSVDLTLTLTLTLDSLVGCSVFCFVKRIKLLKCFFSLLPLTALGSLLHSYRVKMTMLLRFGEIGCYGYNKVIEQL